MVEIVWNFANARKKKTSHLMQKFQKTILAYPKIEFCDEKPKWAMKRTAKLSLQNNYALLIERLPFSLRLLYAKRIHLALSLNSIDKSNLKIIIHGDLSCKLLNHKHLQLQAHSSEKK